MGSVFDLNTPPLVDNDNLPQNNPALNDAEPTKPAEPTRPDEVTAEEGNQEIEKHFGDGKIDKDDIPFIKETIENDPNPASMVEKRRIACEVFTNAQKGTA